MLALFALAACSTTKKATQTQLQGFKYSYCTPTAGYKSPVWNDTGMDIPLNNLSLHDRLICSELGVSKTVYNLLLLKNDTTSNYKKLLLKQQIGERIAVAQTELEAIAAELDCEGERANLAAIYLDNQNSKRNKLLTAGSVVIGAATTVATIIINKKSAQTATGITGGVISAGLALLTVSPKGKQIAFYHERNLLQNIWEDENRDTVYTPFIWTTLHQKQFSNSGQITLTESIKKRWLQFEFGGEDDPEQEKLLFGKGGLYHADDLHTRSAMLNQLQSTIRSINQDLAGFVVFIADL